MFAYDSMNHTQCCFIMISHLVEDLSSFHAFNFFTTYNQIISYGSPTKSWVLVTLENSATEVRDSETAAQSFYG